ncbi:MAG: VanZ family protein [Polyangiaceae bacterium]
MTATYVPSLLRNRRLAFTLQVLPAIVYGAGVFYTGLMRMPELPEVGFVATDKLLHASVFGGLALLIAVALHGLRPAVSIPKKLVLGGLGSSALGLLLELCQSFVPYRSADGWDWVADSVGALLVTGVVFFAWRWRRRVHG